MGVGGGTRNVQRAPKYIYIYTYYDDISASYLTMLYASLIATSFEQ